MSSIYIYCLILVIVVANLNSVCTATATETDAYNEVVDNAAEGPNQPIGTTTYDTPKFAGHNAQLHTYEVSLEYLHHFLAALQSCISFLDQQTWTAFDLGNRDLLSQVLGLLWELKENAVGLQERTMDLRENARDIQNASQAALEHWHAVSNQKLEFVQGVGLNDEHILHVVKQLLDDFVAHHQAKLGLCAHGIEQQLLDFSAQVQRVADYYKSAVDLLFKEVLGYLQITLGHETVVGRHEIHTKLELLQRRQDIFEKLDVKGAALLDAYEQQQNCIWGVKNESQQAVEKLDVDILVLLNYHLDLEEKHTHEDRENNIANAKASLG